MNYKFYEQKAKEKNKKLLIENNILCEKNSNIEFLSSGKLIESEGNKYEALAIIKNVPVSRYTENKNGRIYGRSLWSKVLESGSYKGTYALADHPEDEGSVHNIWGIWHEMEVKEDGVYGTLYLIEEKPVKILKAGGNLGTSTVGYGEFKEDGRTVEESSFELERLADIVMNPSQGTYATFENTITEQKEEKIEKNNNIFLKEITNNKNENSAITDSKLQENNGIIHTNKVTKSEDLKKMDKEKILNIKNHVKQTLKEARGSKDYKKSIAELEELYVDLPDEVVDQKILVKEEIEGIKTRMEKEIVDTSLALKTKTQEYDDLKIKFDTTNSALSKMTEDYKKAEAIINKVGLKEDVDSVCYKKEDAETMQTNLKEMKEDIDQFTKDRDLMESDLKVMEEDMNAMLDDIKKFKEERAKFQKQLKEKDARIRKAETHITKLEKILEDDFDYTFDDEDEDEMEEQIIVDGKLYKEDEDGQVADQGLKDITGGTVAKSSYDNVSVEDNSNSLGNYGDRNDTMVDVKTEGAYDEDKEAEDSVDIQNDKKIADTYSEETDSVEAYRKSYTLDEQDPQKITEAEEDEKKDDEDKEDEKKEDEKKDKEEVAESYKFRYNGERDNRVQIREKKEVKKPVRIVTTKEIVNFYESVIKEKPALKDYKKEILSSKSLTEAIDKVATFKQKKSNKDVKIKVNESFNKKDEKVTYKFSYK